MQGMNRWMVVFIIMAGFSFSACTQRPETRSKSESAKVERIQETDLNRIKLSAKSAERLGLKTAPVRDAQTLRKRIVGGEVMASPSTSAMSTVPVPGASAASGDARVPGPGAWLSEGKMQLVKSSQALSKVADLSRVWVRVPLSAGDLRKAAQDQPARVLPLARDNGGIDLTARPVERTAVGAPKETTAALYYMIDSAEHGLVPGQRVRVELSLSGNGTQQTVIPYAAVIYDLHGDTWTYTNPEPLHFVRHRIHVDYIEGDLAFLSHGPPSGTAVVTTGAAELFGTEFEIGK